MRDGRVFELRAGELRDKLLNRGYSATTVGAGINRARMIDRSEALKQVENRKNLDQGVRQHRLIVEFDRRTSPALGKILENNYEAACARVY